MAARGRVGETTITGKNQISLPAKGLRDLGWRRGDRLIIDIADDNVIILVRRPERWSQAFAGRLGHIFGTHEETIRFLEGERRSWEPDGAGE